MSDTFDPLYCHETYDAAPSPTETQEDQFDGLVVLSPKASSPRTAEQREETFRILRELRERAEAEDADEKRAEERYWRIRRMQMRVAANPNSACNRRLYLDNLVGLPDNAKPPLSLAYARPQPKAIPMAPPRPSHPPPDAWIPLVAYSKPIVVRPTPIRPLGATIASPVASPALIVARPTPIRPPLAPFSLHGSFTAPILSPTLAPEASQPHTRPAGPKKPAGRSRNRTHAAPALKTRAQIKAQEARAAKIHGLDATLIIESRLRSSRKTKK